jgi:enoyl-CoA hydratase/carnithine racemase
MVVKKDRYIYTERRLDDHVAIVQIKRPEAMNALNLKLVNELKDLISQLEDDSNIACVVLTGMPDYFVAGADVRELNGLSVKDAYLFAEKMKALHNQIVQSKKPYVAAIQGYCLGGGFELALACDIRLADATAKFGLPEINLGIIPGGGGIQRLLELVGTSLASQIIMTGDMFDAERAKELNIVNSISADVMEEAISAAAKIGSKSRYAIAASKKLLNQRKLNQSAKEFEEEIHEFALLFDYPDAFEGLSAFIEKRKPAFQKGEV